MNASPVPVPVVIHVAVARNGVIGRDNGLPWKLSTDLRRFKAATMGKPVVMGRKTFEGLGRPLPGRLNVVVTRDPNWQCDGTVAVHSLEAALEIASARLDELPGAGEICVIGGGEIYRQALPLAARLHVTHVEADFEGDTHFPTIDPADWRESSREDVPAGERDTHPTRHVVYERRD